MTAICCAVRRCLYAVLFATIAATASATSLYAQDTGESAAPVPPALIAAKTVFISNAGADSGLFPEPFSGEPARVYNTFYTHLKATNAFQLVDSPAQADLVLEIALEAPSGPIHGSKMEGTSDPLPMFRLTVYDRPTHYVLWTQTASIDSAMTQKTHDRNFDTALDKVIFQLLKAAGRTTRPGAH